MRQDDKMRYKRGGRSTCVRTACVKQICCRCCERPFLRRYRKVSSTSCRARCQCPYPSKRKEFQSGNTKKQVARIISRRRCTRDTKCLCSLVSLSLMLSLAVLKLLASTLMLPLFRSSSNISSNYNFTRPVSLLFLLLLLLLLPAAGATGVAFFTGAATGRKVMDEMQPHDIRGGRKQKQRMSLPKEEGGIRE